MEGGVLSLKLLMFHLKLLQQFDFEIEWGHSILCEEKQTPKPQKKPAEGRGGQKQDY